MLLVRNVRLPPAAIAVALQQGVELGTSPLVDILYSRGRTSLDVYMRRSVDTSVPPSDGPFHTVCDHEPFEMDTDPSSDTEPRGWTKLAHIDGMSLLDSTPADRAINGSGSLAIPGGLCHPHLHLDKCFLLDRCKIDTGTFEEAMTETTSAKASFHHDDLMCRGRRLVQASISHGVTVVRAHVEVDPTVQLLCVKAGIALQKEFSAACDIQLVAFAQDPLLYPDDPSKQQKMAQLLEQAASTPEVGAIGSAPYVESSTGGPKMHLERQQQNISAVFDLAARNGKDVDLHLDYDLDPEGESLVPYVLEMTAAPTWKVRGRTRRITLGHCTKLSVLPRSQLAKIHTLIEAIPRPEGEPSPISFVGLPLSDVYMQGRAQPYASRSRATLPLLDIAKHLDVHCALGVNNVGNLFTPQGDADPLALLPWATALYQDATQPILLLEMVSTQARHAAGVDAAYPAIWTDLTILDGAELQSAVLAPPFGRITIKDGQLVSDRKVISHLYHA